MTNLPFIILPLDSTQASLELAGGKGANLARLVRAGFQVPDGFIITTRAYGLFVGANFLQSTIQAALDPLDPGSAQEPGQNPGQDTGALEAASQAIRDRFAQASLPSALAQQIRAAYSALNKKTFAPANHPSANNISQSAVAVRSSATAEDLPDVSFAGQQDTFLNVIGEQALLEAVVRCWSSLWTPRAIGYRLRNAISQQDISLAVVVQCMVESEVSGVLFTANPVSGLRTETVIDATYGLGEALVSGQVEPDHYVVDPASRTILRKQLGAKGVAIRSQAGGGVAAVRPGEAAGQALPDEAILTLSRLGQQAAAEYQSPQDIEWAWRDGHVYLLQSRPITSLFPIPEGLNPDRLHVMASFGAVQGMLDPITPLGRDVLLSAFASAAGLYGFRRNYKTQGVGRVAGERLWLDLTNLATNTVGRSIMRGAFTVIEPSIGKIWKEIQDDPRLQPTHRGIRPGTAWRLIRFALPGVWRVIRAFLWPDTRRRYVEAMADQAVADFSSRAHFRGDTSARLQAWLDWIGHFMQMAPRFMLEFVPMVVTGMASLFRLQALVEEASGKNPAEAAVYRSQALRLTRGLPYNVTTQMDLMLWETTRRMASDLASAQAFAGKAPAELAALYLQGNLPPAAQHALEGFFSRYGMRGVGEIDLGRPRWREDPTPVMQAVSSYLRIDDPAIAPDGIFQRSADSAQQALTEMEAAVRQAPAGWLKVRLLRLLAGRVRALAGLRESPKFFIIRILGIARQSLLEIGGEYVMAGVLDQTDDLFYLSLEDLSALAAGQLENPRQRAASHRAAYNRELLRRRIPRLLLSDGRAFYEGLGAPEGSGSPEDGRVLTGSPVSPGVAEGSVRIVLSPHGAHLGPGEILVCPGTDPSWTPLFLAAGGLVMEVGGMMTHGAVVAREYGIPAIVGVHQAVTRLKTGQRIRMDGGSGVIEILG